MTALDKLKATHKRTNNILKTLGFGILDDDFKPSILTFVSIFDCASYMCINAYDIGLFWGDLVRVCFCLVTWSFGYQCSIRIYVFFFKNKQIREMWDQLYAFFKIIDRDPTMEKIVNKFAGYIYHQTLILSAVFCLTGLLTLTYPAVAYLYSKEVILPLGFFIPGLSYTENPGYALNYCHHAIQAFMTVPALVATQSITVMFLIGACLMIESLIAKLDNLGKDLQENRVDVSVYEDIDLSEIIEFHQQIILFVEAMESLFTIMMMVDVFSISFQIIITLMVLTKSIWIPGIAIMGCVTFMLILDCGYGLYIEMKFDHLCTAVYDLPWHLMSVKDRKTILFILARTQRPPLLTFGKMAKMNMATFVKVYKSIYSYFMVLKSFEA